MYIYICFTLPSCMAQEKQVSIAVALWIDFLLNSLNMLLPENACG